jgi:hypothetical protein
VWLQPWAVLFAVLPAALLLFAWKPQLLLVLQGAPLHRSSSNSAENAVAAAEAGAAAAAAGTRDDSVDEDEWVVILEGALLENQPGPYLQLQVSLSGRGLTRYSVVVLLALLVCLGRECQAWSKFLRVVLLCWQYWG